MHAASHLTITCEKNCACVAITGSAGLPEATALKRFYVPALMEGIDDFTLECAGCTAMDSAFLGALTALVLKLKQANGKFRTSNLRRDVLGQMASLGLKSFLLGGK